MRVFHFYLAYRALVRAKVDAIRAGQPGIKEDEKHEAEQEFHAYLKLARSYTRLSKPGLIITRGMSASGKSTLTQPLLESMGAIRIRSDVERKRLFGIPAGTGSAAGIDKGIYSAEAGIKTYEKLLLLANALLEAGITVIVDAAFLKYEQRRSFRELALNKYMPFIILEFSASAETLRQRIKARTHDVSDADLSVLEHQLATAEPVRENERSCLIEIDTEKAFDADNLLEKINKISNKDAAT
jgi:predicted kinase